MRGGSNGVLMDGAGHGGGVLRGEARRASPLGEHRLGWRGGVETSQASRCRTVGVSESQWYSGWDR